VFGGCHIGLLVESRAAGLFVHTCAAAVCEDDEVMDGAEPTVQLHCADRSQVGLVLAVLDEAAAWLYAAGVQQWPLRFKPEWVRSDIEQGRTWLAWANGEPVATITLGWSDPLWEPADESGGYVHRLAVRRDAAGLGVFLLQWASTRVRRRNRQFLRLDCVAANDRLRSYYEQIGFLHCGEVEVAGAPGQRGGAARTVVSRYQRALNPLTWRVA